jgi:hypothetical protein
MCVWVNCDPFHDGLTCAKNVLLCWTLQDIHTWLLNYLFQKLSSALKYELFVNHIICNNTEVICKVKLSKNLKFSWQVHNSTVLCIQSTTKIGTICPTSTQTTMWIDFLLISMLVIWFLAVKKTHPKQVKCNKYSQSSNQLWKYLLQAVWGLIMYGKMKENLGVVELNWNSPVVEPWEL